MGAKNEPDEQLMGQIDHGDIAHRLQSISATEQADPEHAIFKAGHQKGKIGVVGSQFRPNDPPKRIKSAANGGRYNEDTQIGGLHRHIQKDCEQHTGQNQIDHKLGQAFHDLRRQDIEQA